MRRFNANGKPLYSDGGPLTAMMDNVLAARLGAVALAAGERTDGMAENIDFGLRLRRLLEEAGFEIRESANVKLTGAGTASALDAGFDHTINGEKK